MSDQEVDLGMSQEEVAVLAQQFERFVTMENLPPHQWKVTLERLLHEAVGEGISGEELPLDNQAEN